MPKKLKQAHGNWVDGDRFWNREKDIELMIKKLDEGAHLLLVAQRRMGKTSLMMEIKRQLEDRYTCLFVDLQKAQTAEDAIVELSLALKPYNSLWNKTKDIFSNALRTVADSVEGVNIGDIGIKLRAGLTSANWSEKADDLFAILAEAEKPVVLMIDEVPLLVNRLLKGDDFKITPERKAAVDEWMSWLRKTSLAHQGKIRIVLSGSIGFEPILHQASLSATINNFDPFELKPWDDETAVGCLQALALEYGVTFQENAEEAMVKKLGYGIPHHVQMFFNRVYDHCVRKEDMTFKANEVEKIYAKEMLGIRGHAELTHYEERLKLVLGPELFTPALEILTEIAVTGYLSPKDLIALLESYPLEGTNPRDAGEEIVWVLEHDGYIKRGAKGFVFQSNLLRDWWKKRYGDFHVSIHERSN